MHVHRTFGRGQRRTRMKMPYWGPDLTEDSIEAALSARQDVTARRYNDFDELILIAAERLAKEAGAKQ